MNILRSNRRSAQAGFTLVEASLSMAIATAATAGCLLVFIQIVFSFNESSLMRTASGKASIGLDRMVYGISTNPGLREAYSNDVVSTLTNGGWKISYTNNGTYYFQYTTNNRAIYDQSGNLICTDLVNSTYIYTTNGCKISVTVAESAGGRILTSQMSTFVEFRN